MAECIESFRGPEGTAAGVEPEGGYYCARRNQGGGRHQLFGSLVLTIALVTVCSLKLSPLQKWNELGCVYKLAKMHI